MKGLDTNFLVRFLVNDDPKQAAQAATFITAECTPESPGVINRNRTLGCDVTTTFDRRAGRMPEFLLLSKDR